MRLCAKEKITVVGHRKGSGIAPSPSLGALVGVKIEAKFVVMIKLYFGDQIKRANMLISCVAANLRVFMQQLFSKK